MSTPSSTVHTPGPSGELVYSEAPSPSPLPAIVPHRRPHRQPPFPLPIPPRPPPPHILLPQPPPRPEVLNVYNSTHRANTQATLASYYHAVSALIRGDTRRPQLPFELVIYIVRLAKLTLPHPSKLLSSLHKWRPYSRLRAGWRDARVVLVPLLKTPPLPRDALQAIDKVEVVVNFLEDIQYKSADYWNIFHIGITERAEAQKNKANSESSESLAWPCFEPVPPAENHPDNQPLAPFEPMRRVVIGYDREIWQHAIPGDRIEVSTPTQNTPHPGVSCEAVIRVFTTWEPSVEMLKLF
ncbi:hypothetical protein BDV93DRAFT_524463 [Ceratobasidium sp. AG-I]|nr:hypothetical protein BDV93DRAFT_524463 [Ceratobasidium sp. AG-I]